MSIPDPSTNLNPQQEERVSAEIAQLNEKIADYQKQISEWLYELGLAYYEQHKWDEEIEEKDKIIAISHHYEQIRLLKNRINSAPEKLQCPNCGADIISGSVFCHICGENLEALNIEHKETAEPVCPYCYSKVRPDDIFCYVCGARISD